MIPEPTHSAASTLGYFVSAPWRSSGKTLITIGLAAAARRRGLRIQTFKKGPDYIDPLWLRQASGSPCYNLDTYLQTDDELLSTFQRFSTDVDVSLVEGTMGLHDGLSTDGSDSNAAVARQLELPVVLVVDCRGMHRTVAALIKGIESFDPAVSFAGVILNRLRSPRHEEKIRRAMDEYSELSLLGAVAETHNLQIDECELGLTPAAQLASSDSASLIDKATMFIEEGCDIDALFPSKSSHSPDVSVPVVRSSSTAVSDHREALTVGIAKDEAFHFYYEDDLEELKLRGIDLVELSPVSGQFPEHLDGLLIGGGFPERYAASLVENTDFRTRLNRAVAQGLPVRAECAGLMYLCRSLRVNSVDYPMVGSIDAEVTMHKRPQGRGYMQLKQSSISPVVPAHEFHHSRISFDNPPHFNYRVVRGFGVDGENDGVCVHNVIASYAHFRHTSATPWVDWFVDQIESSKYTKGSVQHV